MSQPVIALDSVNLSYGAKPALRGISLRIDEGESVSFIGPNGSGKSTCLRLLIGLALLHRRGGEPGDRLRLASGEAAEVVALPFRFDE